MQKTYILPIFISNWHNFALVNLAIAVPITLQQKNKNLKPLIINNDSSIITKPYSITGW